MSCERYDLAIMQRSGVIQGRVTFPVDFTGFDGHFAGRPILPGFMHVQAAMDVLRELGAANELRGVESAKFVRAIFPEEEVMVSLRAISDRRYEVELAVEGEVCSGFNIEVE